MPYYKKWITALFSYLYKDKLHIKTMRNTPYASGLLGPFIRFYRYVFGVSMRIRYIKNWYSYYLVRIGFLNSTDIKFWNGNQVLNYTKDKPILPPLLPLFNLKQVSNPEEKYLLRFKDFRFFIKQTTEASAIIETFIREQYSRLTVKNRVVVDIGANVGDSAIYFAARGAKRIYSFEPYTYSFKLAVENIKLNNLTRKIKLLNEAVDGKRGKIRIPITFVNTAGSSLKSFDIGKTILVVKLEDIVKKYKLKDALLKMDCEGSEYAILLGSNRNTLRTFNQIVVECHKGYLNIEKKLKETGFEVKHTLPYNKTNILWATRI